MVTPQLVQISVVREERTRCAIQIFQAIFLIQVNINEELRDKIMLLLLIFMQHVIDAVGVDASCQIMSLDDLTEFLDRKRQGEFEVAQLLTKFLHCLALDKVIKLIDTQFQRCDSLIKSMCKLLVSFGQDRAQGSQKEFFALSLKLCALVSMIGMNFLHIQIEEEDVFLCQHSHSRRLIHISQYLLGPGVTPSDVKHQRALAIVGSTQRIEINVHLRVQDGTYE